MNIPPPRCNILVVDDDPVIRECIETLLFAELDADVELASDGAEGLARGLARQYDVIVTDIRMPNLTGLEMLIRLRNAGVHTPAIIASGSGLPPGDLAGAKPFIYVSKPDLSAVISIVRTLAHAPVGRHDDGVLREAAP